MRLVEVKLNNFRGYAEEKASKAKKRLNAQCVREMTPDLLDQTDARGELRTWLREIGRQLVGADAAMCCAPAGAVSAEV